MFQLMQGHEETGLDNGAPNGISTRSYSQPNLNYLFTPGDAELKCKDEVDKMDAVSAFARLCTQIIIPMG